MFVTDANTQVCEVSSPVLLLMRLTFQRTRSLPALLREMYISSNTMSGPIPPEISVMQNLRYAMHRLGQHSLRAMCCSVGFANEACNMPWKFLFKKRTRATAVFVNCTVVPCGL